MVLIITILLFFSFLSYQKRPWGFFGKFMGHMPAATTTHGSLHTFVSIALTTGNSMHKSLRLDSTSFLHIYKATELPDKNMQQVEWPSCFPRNLIVISVFMKVKLGIRKLTYANGLRAVNQNQLLPPSGRVIVRTRATLAKLIHVQKVSNAAWPLLGAIMPSNLQYVDIL